MNKDSLLSDLQANLENDFAGGPLDRLNYHQPERLRKNGYTTVRLLIHGKAARHIWSSKWCFFEFELPIPPVESHGAVGFISYPDNKQCGGGRHRENIRRILADYANAHPQFSLTPADKPFLGIYARYDRRPHPAFPQDLAITDMRTLNEGTFEKLNLLGV